MGRKALHNGAISSRTAVGAVHEGVKESDPEDNETMRLRGPSPAPPPGAGEVAPAKPWAGEGEARLFQFRFGTRVTKRLFIPKNLGESRDPKGKLGASWPRPHRPWASPGPPLPRPGEARERGPLPRNISLSSRADSYTASMTAKISEAHFEMLRGHRPRLQLRHSKSSPDPRQEFR
jgi:hypothetical protein